MDRFRFLERFTLGIEKIAGVLLGIVTLLIVVSAIGRYVFALPVPDAFDMSRFLIGARRGGLDSHESIEGPETERRDV